MSTTSSSTSGSRPTSRQYDTGFPDSFASCTTSMRHPDAIIDPGFAISSEHIDPSKSLHRSRKSMLRKHRKTISHGKIDEEELAKLVMERPSSRPSEASSLLDQAGSKSYDPNTSITRPSTADTGSLGRVKESESVLGLSPGFRFTGDDTLDKDERRKSNIFRKLVNKP
ncbi:hypothetical protein F5Y08DRAFT_341413 [Xylaria arbuscula]|nr:hypothetical protein F5Y08DRAFT_341413 [Xylaria arbuscula]